MSSTGFAICHRMTQAEFDAMAGNYPVGVTIEIMNSNGQLTGKTYQSGDGTTAPTLISPLPGSSGGGSGGISGKVRLTTAGANAGFQSLQFKQDNFAFNNPVI